MGKSRDLADLVASGSILADGTLSTTEIDGVTATSTELNLLDGITRGSILYGADGDSSARLSIGSSGTVLTSNGTDISWNAPAASGLQNISEDTTPQLGGNLDLNGNDLVTTSNADIDLDPNGTGTVVFKGNSTKGAGQFKLNCEVNSHGITIKGPPHSAAASYTLTLPNDDGNADQVLSTNGSGTLSWADVGGGGECQVWCYCTMSGSTVTLQNDTGVTSITDDGVGVFIVNLSVTRTSQYYATSAGAWAGNIKATTRPHWDNPTTKLAVYFSSASANTLTDPSFSWSMMSAGAN